MMDEALIFAKKYLEDILSFFNVQVDVKADYENDVILLDVPSTHLNGFLIGRHSETLKSLHTLVFAAVQQQTQESFRLNIDIANYKKHRTQRLTRQALIWIKEVKESGASKKLHPMNPAERRIIHQLANEQGLSTESMGEGADRHVVLKHSPR